MTNCVDHGRKGFGGGYATAWLHGQTTTLHRKVFFDTHGTLPEVVRHTCDNRRCINPTHLVAGTQVDNMADMVGRGRQGDCRNFGAANGMTVLTPLDVEYIKENYKKSCRENGSPALARKFGVGTTQIFRVLNGIHHK